MNDLLQQLEELYAMRDAIELDKMAKREQIIPVEIQHELEALEIEYEGKEAKLAERINELESSLKADVLDAGKTLQGSHLQVIYRPGGKSVSAKDLLALASRWEMTNQEVAAEMRGIITVKKASVSIEPRKNG